MNLWVMRLPQQLDLLKSVLELNDLAQRRVGRTLVMENE